MPTFQLRILGLQEALEADPSWPTHIVSLNDSVYDGPYPEARAGGHRCCLHFDDIDPIISEVVRGEVLATPELLKAILDFTAGLGEGDQLLVHCMAGISRSTATASAILYQHSLSIPEIEARVREVRPIAWPNTFMLGIYDQLLNANGSLKAMGDNWQEPDWSGHGRE